jgi:hypothetical protein
MKDGHAVPALQEPLPDATPVFAVAAALDFDAADEIDALSERTPLISSYDLEREQDGTKCKK